MKNNIEVVIRFLFICATSLALFGCNTGEDWERVTSGSGQAIKLTIPVDNLPSAEHLAFLETTGYGNLFNQRIRHIVFLSFSAMEAKYRELFGVEVQKLSGQTVNGLLDAVNKTMYLARSLTPEGALGKACNELSHQIDYDDHGVNGHSSAAVLAASEARSKACEAKCRNWHRNGASEGCRF